MSDSAVVITIEWRGAVKIMESDGGGGVEDTGRRVTETHTRTVVAAKQMCEFALEQETALLMRDRAPCEILGVSYVDVGMIYRGPVYWM